MEKNVDVVIVYNGSGCYLYDRVAIYVDDKLSWDGDACNVVGVIDEVADFCRRQGYSFAIGGRKLSLVELTGKIPGLVHINPKTDRDLDGITLMDRLDGDFPVTFEEFTSIYNEFKADIS